MSNGGPLFGSGGFFGQQGGGYGPAGQYGMWPTCGCSSFLLIFAGIALVCAGVLRGF